MWCQLVAETLTNIILLNEPWTKNIDFKIWTTLKIINLKKGLTNFLKLVMTKVTWGCIFSCVRPFYEQAVSDLGP
jgi:hypothetical protein